MRTTLLFACLSAIALASRADAQLLSPGELSRAHRGLEGDDHCLDCHSSGKRVDDGLCLRCHGDVDASRRAGKGLHGKAYRDDSCGKCHLEHRGASYSLIRWRGGSSSSFDHRETGWPLRGAHGKTKCLDCHRTKNERGTQTFIGLSTECASCHEDPHDKRFGQDCAKCHDEQSFANVDPKRFDHALARFALTGAHVKVACGACHGTPPAEVKWRGLDFTGCTSCHDDPHRGDFGKECTSCHTEMRWQDVSMPRGRHPGLSLAAGHAKVACATCHDDGLSKAPSRGSRCVDCHAPVHDATFGNNCARCHGSIRWLGLPDSIGLAAHAKTAFALHGRHEGVRCVDCHSPSLPPARRFRNLPFERCLDCHRDPHAGEFTARDGGECRTCHDEHGFLPTRFSIADHATTSYPLVGRHEAVACAACHAGDRPRLDWRIADSRCATCHENPHGEQFAVEMRDGGCAHCHSPVAWNAPNIDHSTWPLTGAHAGAACASCHEPAPGGAAPGAAAAASYRGVPRACEGCHDDPHLGQFRLTAPVRACDFCHRTETFDIAKLDHDALTGYPLDGKHASVECARCHAGTTLRNGARAIRYRLGHRACADCHANPHAGGGR